MYLRHREKTPVLVGDEKESTGNDKLETEEGQKKAQSLFTKKFMEYLSSKKSNSNVDIQKSPSRSREASSSLISKDYASSDETSDASCSSWKSSKKIKRKLNEKSSSRPTLTFDYACRSKLIQCNMIKESEEVIVSEELKPFLMNMTILLQELKQTWKSTTESDGVYNLLSKITILISEFSRRQITEAEHDKRGDHFKHLAKTMETILNLINEHKKMSTLDFDNGIQEYKKMEKEIEGKEEELEEAKQILSLKEQEEEAAAAAQIESKETEIEAEVKNSIVSNERLKALISFNQSHIKKYKKFLLEKEWTKHKLDNELVHLRKKISKSDLTDETESYDKSIASPEVGLKSHMFKKSSSSKQKSPRTNKDKSQN